MTLVSFLLERIVEEDNIHNTYCGTHHDPDHRGSNNCRGLAKFNQLVYKV